MCSPKYASWLQPAHRGKREKKILTPSASAPPAVSFKAASNNNSCRPAPEVPSCVLLPPSIPHSQLTLLPTCRPCCIPSALHPRPTTWRPEDAYVMYIHIIPGRGNRGFVRLSWFPVTNGQSSHSFRILLSNVSPQENHVWRPRSRLTNVCIQSRT